MLDLGGRPLVVWSVAAAAEATTLSRVILSTDDHEIASVAGSCGCEVPFQRPATLATDTASIYDVLFHALEALSEPYDYIVLLQATSPFRTGADIDACVRTCIAEDVPACVSVTRVSKPLEWFYSVDARGSLRKVMPGDSARRQDSSVVVTPNGAVYVARPNWLAKTRRFIADETRAYMMPPERSIDIDTDLDLLFARAILAEREVTHTNR